MKSIRMFSLLASSTMLLTSSWSIGLTAPSAPGRVCLYRSPSGPDALSWATNYASNFRELDLLGFPPNGLWTERQYVQEITSQLSTIFSVWDEQSVDSATLLAFVCCERVLDETHMLSLTVHPDYRGRGLAKALVLASLCSAKAAGQRLMTLEVRTSNQAAFELYRSCGMQYVGKRKRYYRAPAEDALLLTTCFSASEDALEESLDDPTNGDPAEGLQLDVLVQQSDVADTIRRVAADSAACSRGEAEQRDLAMPQLGPGSFGQLLGHLPI